MKNIIRGVGYLFLLYVVLEVLTPWCRLFPSTGPLNKGVSSQPSCSHTQTCPPTPSHPCAWSPTQMCPPTPSNPCAWSPTQMCPPTHVPVLPPKCALQSPHTHVPGQGPHTLEHSHSLPLLVPFCVTYLTFFKKTFL